MIARTLIALLLACCTTKAAFFNNYDWEAQRWGKTVVAGVSGAVVGVSYVAGTRWILEVRQAGLRKTVLRANLFGGAAATTDGPFRPIIKDVGSASDSSGGAPTYSTTNGFLAAANGDNIATGFNPTNLTANDAHCAIYQGGTAFAEAAIVMGVTAFGGNDMFLTTSYSALGQVADIWTSTGRPVVADSDGRGLYLGSRTSSAATGVAVYRNGVRTGTSTSVGGSPPDTTGTSGMLVLACNSAGSPIGFSTHPGRGYQIGRGLTDSQVAVFWVIWQRYEGTLNRDWTR